MSNKKIQKWIDEAWDWYSKHDNLELSLGMMCKSDAEREFWLKFARLYKVIVECKMKGVMALPPEWEQYKDMPEFRELLKIWGITLRE